MSGSWTSGPPNPCKKARDSWSLKDTSTGPTPVSLVNTNGPLGRSFQGVEGVGVLDVFGSLSCWTQMKSHTLIGSWTRTDGGVGPESFGGVWGFSPIPMVWFGTRWASFTERLGTRHGPIGPNGRAELGEGPTRSGPRSFASSNCDLDREGVLDRDLGS